MEKVGVDDLIAKRGPEVVRELIADACKFDGHPCPKTVHLSEIEDAELGRTRLAIDLMVSAVGDTYLVPKTLLLRCSPAIVTGRSKPKLRLVKDEESDSGGGESSNVLRCQHCEENDGFWEHEIRSPETIVDLTRVPSKQLRRHLSEMVAALCPHAQITKTKARQTVTSFLATPKSRRLRTVQTSAGLSTLDESGRPFREKVLYYLGRLAQPSRYYRGIGVAIPNPKSQEATAFLWQLQPLEEDFESFRVDREIAGRFEAFGSVGKSAWNQLMAVAEDVTVHITKIYGRHRQRSLIGKLLVYHSVRQFRFDGEMLKRGWLEMLEVGDTGQGKTQQVERIVQATGMGEVVDGVSTTRTGLAYAMQKLNDSWFLTWGKYPLNDGRLLYIDEAQMLSVDDIDKIRKGRSDGVITAVGVRSGEHPTRTRLIMTCNPRRQGVVDDALFGIELVKQTFKDEDIRRFDFAIISSSSDEKADINKPRSGKAICEQRITPDLLRDSVRWAWSRNPDDVTFIEEATAEVYTMAQLLTHLYGEARDIPLVLESDIRHKVARIAVAIAALLHSTDETHQKVIVTPEHVQAVGDFLSSIYNHPNCSLDLYAKIRRDESGLTDDEYDEIWTGLRDCEVTGTTTLAEDDIGILLRAFVTHGGQITRQDLAGELGKTPEWTSKVVRVLKSQKLIRAGKGRSGGYRATPKFNKFLKLAIGKRELTP